jgi:hypothetical protein
MSNYTTKAKKPKEFRIHEDFEEVWMLDDFYGIHQYAVSFQDGSKFKEEDCEFEINTDEL